MADTGIFATTAEIQAKCGADADSTYTAEAYTNQFVAQAESLINVDSNYNWSDAYAGLNADVKKILTLAASAKAAQYCISANMKNYSSISDALVHLNFLDNEYSQAIGLLKDKINKGKFIIGA